MDRDEWLAARLFSALPPRPSRLGDSCCHIFCVFDAAPIASEACAVIRNTDAQWREWGRTDPYYAVLSHDAFRKDNVAEHARAFFESGFDHADEVLSAIKRHYGDIKLDSVLDFGCGVGRVVVGLATHCRTIVGIDVSEEMLEEARKNLRTFNVLNATLTVSDDRLSNVETKFDLIHSYIVLQHIPVERGQVIITALLDRLAPSGAIALHVSLRRNASTLGSIAYFVKHRIPGGRFLVNVLTGRTWKEPLVEMNEYDLIDVLNLFAEHGMKEIVVFPERHGKCDTAMIYGRKSATTVG
jgi:SAM-dependent methyltransferase